VRLAAAASVRHPNVRFGVSLGNGSRQLLLRDGVVDGKPLDELIRQFGRLEVKLALEITAQN